MFLSRAEVRAVDRRAIDDYGVPGVVLMENAGRGVVDVMLAQGGSGPVTICCGKGNNGGDGFVIARHLDNRGIAVQVLLFAKPEELTGDAAINYQIIARAGLSIIVWPDEAALAVHLGASAWVVDALFGTGLAGPLRAPFDGVIAAINAATGARVLAVDIPSGLDCDTGDPLGPTVRAQHTVTFVAMKQGFANLASREWLGEIHVADIGAPKAAVGK